jgi:hypothetical protein
MARSLCYMAHREKQQYEEGKELLCAPGLTVCCLHLRAVVWLEDEFLFFFSPINPSRPVPYDSTDIEVKAVELFMVLPEEKMESDPQLAWTLGTHRNGITKSPAVSLPPHSL